MQKMGGFGKHTTLNEVGKGLVRFISGKEGVKKVAIGRLDMCGGRKGRKQIELKSSSGCILAMCYQSTSSVEVRIYIYDGQSQRVLSVLNQYLEDNGLLKK